MPAMILIEWLIQWVAIVKKTCREHFLQIAITYLVCQPQAPLSIFLYQTKTFIKNYHITFSWQGSKSSQLGTVKRKMTEIGCKVIHEDGPAHMYIVLQICT